MDGKEKVNDFLSYIDKRIKYMRCERALLYIVLDILFNSINDFDEWVNSNSYKIIEKDLPRLDPDSSFKIYLEKHESESILLKLSLIVKYGLKKYDIYHVIIDKKNYQIVQYAIYYNDEFIPEESFDNKIETLLNNIIENYIIYSGETSDIYNHYICDKKDKI